MKKRQLNTQETFDLSSLVNYVEGSTVSRILAKTGGGNITLFAFSEGQDLSKHKASFDAYVQIIEGEAVITIDDKPFEMKTGEVIIMPANIPHAVSAKSDFKMLLVMLKGEKD